MVAVMTWFYVQIVVGLPSDGGSFLSGAIWRAVSRSNLVVVIVIKRRLRKSIKGVQEAARSCRSEDSTETRCATGGRVVVIGDRLKTTGALAGAKVWCFDR
jgi:hypothetical protein